MSLRFKLLLPLVVASLIALAYIGQVWSPRSLESGKQQYLDEVGRHLDTVIEGLVPLMLTRQLDLIHENIGELRKKNSDWQFILLNDNQGRQLYPPRHASAEQEPVAGANVQVMRKDIRFLGADLGTLVVHVAYARRLDEIRSQHQRLTLMLVAIIALLALTWVGALEAAVVHPLQRLSAAATELARRRFDAPLPHQGSDEVGKLVGSFGIMRDDLKAYHDDLLHEIEIRKQAEAEKSALNESLEQRVAERTAALEAAYKDLEAFSYSVSHDLRTPLRAIDGFSQILVEDYQDKLDAEGQRLLNVVRANTQRMGELINDILEFSRMGRRELKVVPLDMNRLAREVAAELQATAGGRTLRFDIAELPPTRGDGSMIRQVLVNLMTNAVKFTEPRAEAVIAVGGAEKAGENVYSVTDNGVGFDMQYGHKLFGVFERLHAKEQFEGTGIGLAIVKRIVDRHGGRVWAEGRVGEGATFNFSLPRSATDTAGT